jgi:hypothetical protein
LLTGAAGVPDSWTNVTVSLAPNPLPLIATEVPPSTDPVVGLILDTTGIVGFQTQLFTV